MLPDGTGFALKCADGAGRALGPAAAAFLARSAPSFRAFTSFRIANSRGENVGAIARRVNASKIAVEIS